MKTSGRDPSGSFVRESVGPYKNSHAMDGVFTASIASLVLSIFSLNPFTFLVGSFALTALSSEYIVWKNWKRVVSAFFIIAIIILTIVIVVSLCVLIVGCFFKNWKMIVIGLYLTIMSILQCFYVRKTTKYVEKLWDVHPQRSRELSL